jgi:hypothetical protein
MTNREELVDKYIKYIITDMAKIYNINVKQAVDIFKAYDFESLANEYPNETFHYPPEYWAEEIYKSKSLQLS